MSAEHNASCRADFPFIREHRFHRSLLFFYSTNNRRVRRLRHFDGIRPGKENSMLTITGIPQGKCTWCLEHTEVVTAQFRDGLTGSFCKKHLWQALKVRCDTPAPHKLAPAQDTKTVT